MIKTILLGKGSGFGESIVITIPDGRIGIIDSCVNERSEPIALDYLKKNGLSFDLVDFVILTHYHQDHLTGISKILENCVNARFFTSSALNTSNFNFLFHALLEINSRSNPYTEFEKIVEVLKGTNRKIYSISNTSKPILTCDYVTIKAESPNERTSSHMDSIYKYHLKKLISSNESAYIPPKKDFNLQSIVLTIETKNIMILLGADLEYCDSNPAIGWDPIISKFNWEDRNYKVFKIPHHGSENGYNRNDWQTILDPDPYLKIAPFRSHSLPRQPMIENIKSHSENVFITSSGIGSFKRYNSRMKGKLKKSGVKMKRVNAKPYGQISFEIINETVSTTFKGTAMKL